MIKSIRLALVSAAVVILGAMAFASTAQASRGISSSHTRIGVSGNLTMNGLVVCDVLLELTLASSSIAKSTSPAQGTVTAGDIPRCSAGATQGDILFPIPVSYASFNGTLPNISRINVTAGTVANPVGFFLEGLPFCAAGALFGGAASPTMSGISFNVAGGQITGVTFNSALNRNAGGALCPSRGTIEGTLTTFLNGVVVRVALV